MKDNNQYFVNNFLKFLDQGSTLVNVGVFDAASAAVAAKFPETKGLFISGLGYTYSQYAWPDVGLINANEIINAAKIIRSNHPNLFLTCDIDSGFGGKEQLRRTCTELKNLGVSAIQFEDQTLDDKVCGHLANKKIRPLEESIERLTIALESSYPVQVIARTDSSLKNEEAFKRLDAFIKVGAKIVLVDGIDESELQDVIKFVNKRAHIMVNIVEGGKIKQHSVDYFQKLGVSIVNLSVPLLFTAMHSMNEKMKSMIRNNWAENAENKMALYSINEIMTQNYNNFLGNKK
ncbi:isocitrate lyase/PEP mutase family protein [Fluviispira vulneris]|uniref:isocitrate lyase/PEP mutase family protein n=1 Tax=Fluviispira vulneris TaxID=2763012 RepID=UPI0016495AD9|nr:isocitrate lyase/PEP mutase family protein [Fluviispira vulneris]